MALVKVLFSESQLDCMVPVLMIVHYDSCLSFVVYELWFKQILHELGSVMDILSAKVTILVYLRHVLLY